MSRRLLIASDRTIIGLLLATIHLIKAHILLRLSFVSKNLVCTLRSVLRGHARTIEWKAVTHPTSLKLKLAGAKYAAGGFVYSSD